MSLAITARDFELGLRPTCQGCGTELDIETDCHHDGYNGSPHAHGGRGSYGMGSHHFVFSQYCENCADLPKPLREILQYDNSWEWLQCGHKLHTPRDMFGRIRPGDRRRCSKCKRHAAPDFDAVEMLRLRKLEAFSKILKCQLKCAINHHDTRKNWHSYIQKLGLTLENCSLWKVSWYACHEDRAASLKAALIEKAEYEAKLLRFEWSYNSDDH